MAVNKLNAYRRWLIDIGSCQVCNSSDIDIPHHVGIGIKRDDYMQVLLCVGCHQKVHNSSFKWHTLPNAETMELIAKENWEQYETSRS